MRPVTARYLNALGTPHARVAEVTITLPGETTAIPVDIETDECTVTMSGSDGARYSASIALSPDVDADIYDLAATPGAEFRIRSGIDFRLGQIDWVDCGVLYAVDGDRELVTGEFPLTLQDGATRLEETRFPAPWAVAAGTDRSAASTAIVLNASPDVTVQQLATPSLMGTAVYDRDRLPALMDIAKGGSQDQGFNAIGDWLIRDLPTINPAVPSWTLLTGEQGTILPGAKRQIPLSRLYNEIIVGAPEPFQTWGAITVAIADPNHPRHWTKIGHRPAFISDPTITTQAQAIALGQNTLTRVLNVVETIDIPTLGNPALEYGDTVAVVHEPTDTDPGLAANYLVEGWTFNLGTGAQDVNGRSTDQPELEES